MKRVVIVGGGVIGMLLARELAQAGSAVTLLEQGECGREASWAGGGIVSPLYPWRYDPAVTALATWSQDYYPVLAEALLAESGIDPELDQHGMLMLSVADADQALQWSQQHGRWLEPVSAEFIYTSEPALAPGLGAGLHMPLVASIRNPRLAQALRQSLLNSASVTLLEHTGVTAIQVEGDRVRGVVTAQAEHAAEQVVITSGAWSGGLLQPLGVQLPVAPVRGQMILFRAQPGLLGRVVLQDGRYLIPRRDGRILCGSTLEHVGFDKTTTADAKESLWRSAVAMLPALGDVPVEAHWAGLRPGSPNGVPFIGEVPGVAGLFVNAGQFRNGLVLAPGSIRVMADLLLQRPPAIDPRPYGLQGRVVSAN